eukprot:scaffold1279_cov306-Prasinococcus_capsulatus_cf.AAC.11
MTLGVVTRAVVVLAALAVKAAGECDCGSEFVQREGTHFVLNCERFDVHGYNAYFLFQQPYLAPKVFGHAQELNMNVVRVHTFADGYGNWKSLQTQPGVYNWQAWQDMDDMLHQAKQYGQKVIMTIVNYWEAYGGMDQYVAWSPTAWQRSQFYTDAHCKQTYKNHINQLVNRVNHNTGVAYKDDPTILCWQLINEGRIGVNTAISQFWSLQGWLQEMGAYIKSLDSNHMVNAGTEGWFGPQQISGYYHANYNPGSWATTLGACAREGTGNVAVGSSCLSTR